MVDITEFSWIFWMSAMCGRLDIPLSQATREIIGTVLIYFQYKIQALFICFSTKSTMALFSRQLQAFVAVAEELHFGRAAQRLHISQPPLSQQLQQFEEWIGARLIDRTTRSVRLTAAGQVMLSTLQRMAIDGQSAILAAQRVASGDAGSLRIGFTSTAAYRLVPAVVGAYRTQYPDVHLTMDEFTSGILCDGLLRDRFDIALLRRYEDMPDNDLVFTQIDREPLVAAIPLKHPLARRRSIPIALLGDTAVIGFAYATSQYFHTLLRELFARNGVAVRYVMESVLPTILALVESGLGIAIVPASVRELRPDGIAYRPLAAPMMMDSVLYAAHRADNINPTVRKFLGVMTRAQEAYNVRPSKASQASFTEGGSGPAASRTGARLRSP